MKILALSHRNGEDLQLPEEILAQLAGLGYVKIDPVELNPIQLDAVGLDSGARLRDSIALLANAQRLGTMGVWQMDLRTNRLHWSDETCALFGIAPDEFRQTFEHFRSFILPEDRRRLESEIRQEDEAEPGVLQSEYRIRRPDGEIRWMRERGQIEFGPDGEPIRRLGVVMDITESKVAEAEARNLAQQLFNTLESITDAVFTLDHDWRFTYVNSEAERLLQKTKEEMLGNNVWTLFPEAVGTTFYKVYHQAMQEKRTLQAEDYYPPLDTWFNVRAYSSADGVTVYFQDVTQQRRAREELIISEERFKNVARATNDAIWDWEIGTDQVWWNEGMQTLFGYTPEDLEPDSRSWTSHIHPEDHDWVLASLEQAMTDGKTSWVHEYRFICKDGSVAHVLDRAFIIRNEAGQVIRLVGGMTDLTERKQMEERSLRAQRLESLGILAGGIAHDLNNVLAPIMLSIPLLKRTAQTDRDRRRLEMLEESAKRGAEMVRQVLTFARGAEGQRICVRMEEVARDVIRLMEDTLGKDIRIRLNFPDILPPIEGDPTQIHQVLVNLCVNARDAMPQGGNLTIQLDALNIDSHYAGMDPAASPGPYVRLTVADTGTGISSETLSRIFDPFYTTKEQGKGTGLGLSTVRGIVKGHNGFINVYSEEGSGTVFKLYFPAMVDEYSGDLHRYSAELPQGQGELILVVDDEMSVRTITQQTLEAFGYRVLLAEDGAEAVSLYAQRGKEIDLVITDMMMPIMNGFATIQALMKINPDVKIIAASGLAANGMVAKAMSVGVKYFLPKPYTAESILNALADILRDIPSDSV